MKRPALLLTSLIFATAACGGAIGGTVEYASVAVGTDVRVRLDQTLDTRNTSVGARFSATVVEPVTSAESKAMVVIPAGAKVYGEVTAIQEDPPAIKVLFDEIEVGGDKYPADLTVISAQAEQHSEMTDEAAKIGGGAAGGAILGAVIGGDAKGAIIGAAAGAAAGTGVALATKDHYAHLVAGTSMRLRLESLVKLPIEKASAPEDLEEEN